MDEKVETISLLSLRLVWVYTLYTERDVGVEGVILVFKPDTHKKDARMMYLLVFVRIVNVGIDIWIGRKVSK